MSTRTLTPSWSATPAPLRHTWAPIGNIDQLHTVNALQAAPDADLRLEDGHAIFELERPGVALLES